MIYVRCTFDDPWMICSYIGQIILTWCVSASLWCLHSQYGVVPEDADGFGALLGGHQAELHSDGFVQRVLQQLVVVVHRDAHHRRVDDRTLGHPDGNDKKTYREPFHSEGIYVIIDIMCPL